MPNNETAAVAGQSPAGGQELRPATPSGSGWRLRNWPLRSKLAVVLIVPLITALAFGGINAVDQAKQADEFQTAVEQLDLATHVTAVVNELQGERTLAVARMANGPVTRAELDEQFAKVDHAIQNLRTAVGDFNPGDVATADSYDQALQRLDALGPLRDMISNTPFSDLFAYQAYNSIIGEFIQLSRDVHLATGDRELLRAGSTLQSLSESKEYVGRQAAALQIAAGREGFPADLLEQTFAAQASARAAVTNFNANATSEEQNLYAGTVAGAQVDSWERAVSTAFAQAQNSEPIELDRRALTDDAAATISKIYEVETGLLSMMRAKADDLATEATTAVWLFGGVVALALILTLLLMLIVARALLRPLKVLRANALDTAYVRLPETVRRILAAPNPVEASQDAVEPVPVDSRDEIGEVARSFDVVHQRAVRMAAEQATLRENVNRIFVNISRRSQRLVERQLGVIDQLESDEQDPDQLANLFELDHLATRLRRNGESLLVLSGEGLTKSMSKPVPANDVIGAAVSEIEQYARVDVEGMPDVGVQGRCVHDLVHLTAELLDNATYFSAPTTRVTVRAVLTRRNELALQISDQGLGMEEEQLIQANERLGDPPDLDVSVTQKMGLYVVARLAKQHGIAVRLQQNQDAPDGVMARVVVPPQLLTGLPEEAEMPAALPPQPRRPGEGYAPSPSPLPPEQSGVWPSQSASWPSLSDSPSWPSLTDSSLPPLPPLSDSSPHLPQIRDLGQERGHEPTTRMPRPSPPQPGSEDPTRVTPPQQPTQSPQTQSGSDESGLTPLSQPLSLDDLVGGGSKAAGPFVSPPGSEPPPEAPTRRSSFPLRPGESPWSQEPSSHAGSDGRAPEPDYPLEMPRNEPEYVPVTPEPSDTPFGGDGTYGSDGSALDDEIPTRRLPIYQSVVSRWFAEEAPQEESTWDGDVAASPESSDRAADSPVGATELSDGWYSASDEGWHAAHALLEPKGEETTTAGLPKRRPNAYLVPGSIQPAESEPPAPPREAAHRASPPAAHAGESSVARSAEVARNRMKSFQRGYQSGRHALREGSAGDDRADAMTSMSNVFNNRPFDNGTKE